MLPEFQHWPKISRLSKESCAITEKLDGTNGIVHVSPDGTVLAGSRNRWLTLEADNYGFAKWVQEHQDELRTLGEGYHYGEWYGQGIQRNYGLTERRFALFWHTEPEKLPKCVDLVPWLYMGRFYEGAIEYAVDNLHTHGSRAVPGFMKPEGIVVFLRDAGKRYKVLLENDNLHKCQVIPEQPLRLSFNEPAAAN
jgi:hypothetical protein